MDDVLKQMLLKSRDRYDGAVRWTVIILCVVLFLHFTVISEWAVLKGQLVSNRQTLERYREAHGQSVNLQKAVDDFDKSTVAYSNQLGKDLVSRLRDDFERLNAALELALSTSSEFPESAESSPTRGTDGGSSTVVQAAPQRSEERESDRMIQQTHESARDLIREFGLNEENIQAVKRVREDREALVRELTPLIQSTILKPAFEDLNRRWKNQLSAIENNARRVRDLIGSLRESFPEASDDLESMEQAVGSVMEKARGLTFQPPENNRWWRTVSGKQQFSVQLTGEARSDFSVLFMAKDIGDEITRRVQGAVEDQKKITTKLEQDLKSVQQQLNDQIDRLQTLASPLEFLALDLELLLKRLPFLIGFLTALGIGWTTYRAGKLQRLLRTLSRRSSTSEDVLQLFDVLEASSSIALTVALGVFSVLWLGVSVYTAYLSRVVSTHELVLSTVVGLSLIVIASGFRWWTLNRR